MNLEQIIEEINKDVDDELDNDEIISWVNRCMDELSTFAKYEKLLTIPTVTGQKAYNLPTDYLRTIQVVNVSVLSELPLKEMDKTGFKLFGNQLILQPTPIEDGQIELYYEANLPHLEELEDIPSINPSFHDLFVLYTVAKRQYQDDEPERQVNAWNEYQARRSEFIRFKQRTVIRPIKDVFSSWQ